jgi:hypothetical protein
VWLKSHDLNPWREKMWWVATLDQEFVHMENVLRIYEKPLSERQPVVCVDEKPVVLHEDTRPSIPIQPGQVARRDYEYKRCGTANVFCGVEPKAGVHFTQAAPERSSAEFAEFILPIAEHYPTADTIHLVLDNLCSHSRKALVDRFGEQAGRWLWGRFTVHYTLKQGSCPNQAAVEHSLFSCEWLGKRRLGDIDILRRQTKARSRRGNHGRIAFQWRFTRKQVPRKIHCSFTRSRYTSQLLSSFL